MKLALVALLILVFARPAAAEPVRILTGWHNNFTRVALFIPAGTDWELGRVDDGYALRMPITDGFDTSRFFELIPGERILGVSQDAQSGELRLQVDCVCGIDAFLDRPDLLVIDVRDGAPAPNSPFENALDLPVVAPTIAEAKPARSAPFIVPDNTILPLIAVDQLPQLSLPKEVQAPAISQDLPEVSLEGMADLTKDAEVVSDLADLEQSITESLARALTQGLLESDLNAGEGANAGGIGFDFEDALAPGLRASTGVDRAAIADDSFVPISQDGQACLPGRLVDVANWGDDRPYSTQIAEARSALVSEFDRLDEDAVLKLARNFVYFGFGREAVQVLDMDQVQSQERRYTAAIAQIIDDDPFDMTLFEQQASCATEVALWALLAPTADALDSTLDRAAVLRTFRSLPPALQSHLAPKLAQRFVAIGDNDGALQAFAVVETRTTPSLAVDLAEIALSRALGENTKAIKQVVEIVDTDVRVSPEIMITMLTDAIENGLEISENDLLLADTLRFENARLPVATKLAEVQVRAYLYTRNFDAAEALLDTQIGKIETMHLTDLQDEFVNLAVKNMLDGPFLQFAFGELPIGLSAQSEHALAQRLLELGFPMRARDIIAASTAAEAMIERKILRAEIALELGDPTAVVALTDGDASERALQLRRIAEDMLAADGIVSQTYAVAEAEQNQWRRGDWQSLATSSDPLLQAASTVVLDEQITPLDPQQPLLSSRNLIEQSAQSRMVLDDILARFATPAEY